jgi:hypothetical protein
LPFQTFWPQLGAKDLDWVRAYIRKQKEHHANGTIHERLERIAFDELKPSIENPGKPGWKVH